MARDATEQVLPFAALQMAAGSFLLFVGLVLRRRGAVGPRERGVGIGGGPGLSAAALVGGLGYSAGLFFLPITTGTGITFGALVFAVDGFQMARREW